MFMFILIIIIVIIVIILITFIREKFYNISYIFICIYHLL